MGNCCATQTRQETREAAAAAALSGVSSSALSQPSQLSAKDKLRLLAGEGKKAESDVKSPRGILTLKPHKEHKEVRIYVGENDVRNSKGDGLQALRRQESVVAREDRIAELEAQLDVLRSQTVLSGVPPLSNQTDLSAIDDRSQEGDIAESHDIEPSAHQQQESFLENDEDSERPLTQERDDYTVPVRDASPEYLSEIPPDTKSGQKRVIVKKGGRQPRHDESSNSEGGEGRRRIRAEATDSEKSSSSRTRSTRTGKSDSSRNPQDDTLERDRGYSSERPPSNEEGTKSSRSRRDHASAEDSGRKVRKSRHQRPNGAESEDTHSLRSPPRIDSKSSRRPHPKADPAAENFEC